VTTNSEPPDEAEVTEVTQKRSLPLGANGTLLIRNRPALIVIAGSRLGEVVRLGGGEIIIGRATQATVQVQEQGVSRRHARLTVERGRVFLEDLGSSNGTMINGQRVTERTLVKDGDKIQVGVSTIFKFAYVDPLDESFQQAMYNSAMRDALSGAFNRAYFDESLNREFAFAHRHRTHLALLIADIDHFKSVNDTHGHPAGDVVIKGTANRLAQTLRTEDVLCRYGGEEFAIVCRGTPTGGAEQLAERLRALVEANSILLENGTAVKVTVSIGVAGFQDVVVGQPVHLVTRADAALLQAKKAGRNRVVVASNDDPEPNLDSTLRLPVPPE
jgi:two-component system cell cycle response regulator